MAVPRRAGGSCADGGPEAWVRIAHYSPWRAGFAYGSSRGPDCEHSWMDSRLKSHGRDSRCGHQRSGVTRTLRPVLPNTMSVRQTSRRRRRRRGRTRSNSGSAKLCTTRLVFKKNFQFMAGPSCCSAWTPGSASLPVRKFLLRNGLCALFIVPGVFPAFL